MQVQVQVEPPSQTPSQIQKSSPQVKPPSQIPQSKIVKLLLIFHFP